MKVGHVKFKVNGIGPYKVFGGAGEQVVFKTQDGHDIEIQIPEPKSSNKPLKDQSYHQKRIADNTSKIAEYSKEFLSNLKEYTGIDFVSEEDVRRIVKEEILYSVKTDSLYPYILTK